MTEPMQNHPDALRSRIEEIHRDRTAAGVSVAEKSSALNAARDAVVVAEREYKEAFRIAVRAGWREDELTDRLGLPRPDGTTKRRPRRPAQKRNAERGDAVESSD